MRISKYVKLKTYGTITVRLRCWIIAAHIATGYPALFAQSFKEFHHVECGDSIRLYGLGYPHWNPATIIEKAHWGYAKITHDPQGNSVLHYFAAPCAAYTDTLVVLCAKATQITCDTGYYLFEVGCHNPIEEVRVFHLRCGDSVYTQDLSGWGAPEIIVPPKFGHARIILEPTDGGGLLYMPFEFYEGPDYVKVKTRFTPEILYIFNTSCKDISGVKKCLTASPEISVRQMCEHWLVQSVCPITPLCVMDAGAKMSASVFDQIGDGWRIAADGKLSQVYFLVYRINHNAQTKAIRLPFLR